MLDPRDALDQTLKLFDLKASEVANISGIDEQMISKYRHKRKDMNSINLFKVINAMPLEARCYFHALLSVSDNECIKAKT